MHPIKKHLFDTNFQDLTGSKIEGTLALSEELVNLGVMDLLQGLQGQPQDTEPEIPSIRKKPTAPPPDPKEILKLVNFEQLKIRMKKGEILVDIKAQL